MWRWFGGERGVLDERGDVDEWVADDERDDAYDERGGADDERGDVDEWFDDWRDELE